MLTKKLNIDLDAVTFKGLSTGRARMASVIMSILLYLGITGAMATAAHAIDSANLLPDGVALLCASLFLLEYILKGKSVLTRIAVLLVEIMPMSVLYRRDKRILDRGRVELERVLPQLNFETLDTYSTLNPSISSSITDKLVEICRRGDLKSWLNEPSQLASAANLMYQVYITDQFISSC